MNDRNYTIERIIFSGERLVDASFWKTVGLVADEGAVSKLIENFGEESLLIGL